MSLYLAVGSLNREAPYFQGARGEGLTVFAFDEESLTAERIVGTTTVDNPTFLSVDPASGVIYANSEVFGWHEGTVSAYRFDGRDLVYLNKQPTLGSIAAHNAISRSGRLLFVANYAMGRGGPDRSLAVFPIREDGGLGAPVASVAHPGATGRVPDRQERSHAHCVVETAEGGAVLVADLGLDAVLLYRFDAAGALTLAASVDLPPGAGPRHIAQSRDGRFLYVTNELDSTVSVIERQGEALALRQTVTALPEACDSHGADLHLSPDGRFLYASNRGHDSLAVFAVDPADGQLSPLGHVASGGAAPRNFALTPDGRLALVANQNGDAIAIFRRDAATGALSDSGRRIAIGSPVCVRPFRL